MRRLNGELPPFDVDWLHGECREPGPLHVGLVFCADPWRYRGGKPRLTAAQTGATLPRFRVPVAASDNRLTGRSSAGDNRGDFDGCGPRRILDHGDLRVRGDGESLSPVGRWLLPPRKASHKHGQAAFDAVMAFTKQLPGYDLPCKPFYAEPPYRYRGNRAPK